MSVFSLGGPKGLAASAAAALVVTVCAASAWSAGRSPGTPSPSTSIAEKPEAAAPADRGAPVVGFGLTHTPVGDATLQWDPADRRVRLDNLGSSGQDGVDINLGRAEGLFLQWDELVPGPAGNSLTISAMGELANGLPPGPVGTVSIVGPCVIPGCMFCVCIEADYSAIGSMTQRLEAYLDGEPVGVFPGMTGMAASASIWPKGCDKGPARIGPIRTSCYRLCWPIPTPILIGGGGAAIMVDELRILAENPSAEFQNLTSYRVTGADWDVISIKKVSPSFRERPFSALGDATLDVTPDDMQVSIGSSGQDGVSIECGEADAVGLEWAELVGCWPPPACQEPPPPPPDGSILRVSFTGSHGGVAGQFLGHTQVSQVFGGGLEITADYSPVGATLHHIQILNGGVVVGDILDHTGTAALVDEWPDGCGKGGAGEGAQRVACGRWNWRPPVIIRIPTPNLGEQMFVGDEIRILAQNPSSAYNFVETLSVQATAIPGLVITDAVVTARTPCPADFTGDNVFGAADLASLLGSWGAMGGPADLDGDGVVGASDLAALLGSWGNCP